MSKIRFIGSKTRISGKVLDIVGKPPTEDSRFVDAMCGSGAVAVEAAQRGWPIVINDFLKSSVIMTKSRLLSEENVPFENLGGYSNAVLELNKVERVKGFFYGHYSENAERPYFTDKNAMKIDGMRVKIRQWIADSWISREEEELLIGDLMMSVNQVANTAGTYGCFLKKVQRNAEKQITIEARTLLPKKLELVSFTGDVSGLHHHIRSGDIVYLDPPYTKRQYAAYYHILETIAEGSEPTVGGVTGLRDWKNQKSDFCYKTKALSAIVKLVESLRNAKKIYLSYSNTSHVPIERLLGALRDIDEVKVNIHNVGEISDYTPSQKASENRDNVQEWLFEVQNL